MSAFRLFGRPEPVVREVAPGSATSHARPARRAEDLLAPVPEDPGGWSTGRWPTAPGWGGGPVPSEWGGGPVPPAWGGGPLPPGSPPPTYPPPSYPPPASPPPTPVPAPMPPGPGPGTPGAVGPIAPGYHAPAPDPVPHPGEAGALAAAFAADYLSWDEDDPDLRARVLGEYLALRRPVQLGWSGQGRQRADFALPGLVRPDGDGRVLVDVRVRITPYRRVPGGRPAVPEDPVEDGPTVPAAAPAPAARGWRGLSGRWVRLSVAVLALGDRLVVDAEEETDDPWPDPPEELR